MKEDCEDIVRRLQYCDIKEWAILFVNEKMRFHRKHCLGLIFSTSHGVDFFDTILKCLNGEKWSEEGEYGNNFRKFIKHYL